MWTRNYGALGQTARETRRPGKEKKWRGPERRGRGKKLGKDEGWSFEEAERRIPEFLDPCCCPRVENADEKQRLADWTETSCGESGFKTGSTILARHGNYQLLNLTKINFPIGEKN
ncbi:hypothetical protein TNCV_2277041 [Trichonephila clavipes]|nr:hypothetical protein TNCV_2277041 [Trichonephila clavipes]